MKKLFPIFLLLCLAAPFALTYSYLKVEKHQLKRSIKHQIIDGINKSELVLLRFSKKEIKEKLEWEHSKEFEYEGEMYDVVEKVETTDSVSYWCWWDYEETRLNKQLAGILIATWHQNKTQQNHNDLLIQFTKNWLSEQLNAPSLKTQDGFFIVHYTPYSNNYMGYCLGTSSPPPKFI